MRHWWTKSMCGRGQPSTRSWGRWIGTSSKGKESVSAFRYSSSSEGFDKESSSSSGSDDNASENESEDESDIQSQSAHGGRKRVLHKHSAQMPRKKSPAEVDLNNGKVTAHGLEWKFVDDVSVDAYKDIRYKPKLRVADTASISVLDFWPLFFRSESIGEILQETNARLKSRQKRITKGELYKAIGLLYALTLDVRTQRWDYWATASAVDLYPTSAFGVRFRMVRDHFEQIPAALSFRPADDGTDPRIPARALMNIYLCTCPTSATCSAVLCILFIEFY